MGLMLMVVVSAANISDAKPLASSPPRRTAPNRLPGAKTLFVRLKSHKRWFKRLFLIYTDGTYRREAFVQWTFDIYDWILEAVLHRDRHQGFRVLPKRWVLERTFGWRSAAEPQPLFRGRSSSDD